MVLWFILQGTFSTIDPDNESWERQNFVYTIIYNASRLPFVIEGNAVNTTRSLDYETERSWYVTVKSLDSGNPSLALVKTFQIIVEGRY